MKKTAIITLCACAFVQAHAVSTASPDGNVVADFDVVGGVPTYSVDYKGHHVIMPSRLGLDLDNAPDLLDGFELAGTSTSSFDETWHQIGRAHV